VWAEVTGDTYA